MKLIYPPVYVHMIHVRLGWISYSWRQPYCQSSQAAFRHRTPVDALVSSKLQRLSVFLLLCSTLYEVLSERPSLKGALLSQRRNSPQASAPQWTPHFAVVCFSVCDGHTAVVSGKSWWWEGPSFWQLLTGIRSQSKHPVLFNSKPFPQKVGSKSQGSNKLQNLSGKLSCQRSSSQSHLLIAQ